MLVSGSHLWGCLRKGIGMGVALVGWAASVQAGTVSLDTQLRVSVEQDVLNVAISVTNKGNEAAHGIQITVETPVFSWTFPDREVLPVQESHQVEVRKPVTGLAPGRHPLIVRVLYADANRYPFSALTVSSFTIGTEVAPKILGILEPAQVRARARLILRVKNSSDRPERVRIRLLLPRELSADEPVLERSLKPLEETRLAFRLRNFSALSGSAYQVYALIEQDRDGVHDTALAGGTVQILGTASLQRYQGIYLAVFVALLLIIGMVNVWTRWKPQVSASRPPG